MPVLIAALMVIAAVCLCGQSDAAPMESPPDFHPIAYDAAFDTLEDAYGAAAFDHKLDHTDSRYYVINDYYNMTSGNGLHILSNFRTYQQTTEYSCGCASALMVLEHFGNHDYNEADI